MRGKLLLLAMVVAAGCDDPALIPVTPPGAAPVAVTPAIAPPPVAAVAPPQVTPVAPPPAGPAIPVSPLANIPTAAADLPLESNFDEHMKKYGIAVEKASKTFRVARQALLASAQAGFASHDATQYKQEVAGCVSRESAAMQEYQRCRQSVPATPGVLKFEQAVKAFMEEKRDVQKKYYETFHVVIEDKSLDQSQKASRLFDIVAEATRNESIYSESLSENADVAMQEIDAFKARKKAAQATP